MKGGSIAAATLVALSWMPDLPAQQSASFRMSEHAINNGGDPRDGLFLSSPGFQLTIDAIGQATGGLLLSGLSHSLEGGLVAALAPPGEVLDLRFIDGTTLVWAVEPRAADYALYAGVAPLGLDPGYGACTQPPPPILTESVTVPEAPAPGEIRFYLVTARSILGEEGTKGYASGGAERSNTLPCP